ncbi:signal recognition particle protein [Candidatus Fermentibacterales bacterium]|nr:signal recognition particle protein [Candidatus Fermentibacterales bacterium]
MFDRLASRLGEAFRRLTGRGVVSESDLREAMRNIRRALLEADVNTAVVKSFVENVSGKALGERVLSSVTPGQQIIGIVHDELVKLLGGEERPFALPPGRPLVVLLLGLQGTGKTTTAAKLARWIETRSGGRERSMLVAADLQRPAAVEQLRVMAERCGSLFHFAPGGASGPDRVKELVAEAVERAASGEASAVIVDTAGRLHVDEEMLANLRSIKAACEPGLSLLVLDGLSGQDALGVAAGFEHSVGYDAAVLTRMDGDSRGGAALSFRAVTGKPVAFVGTGEGIENLEPFDPGRLAGRILGMGDVVSLVERAQKAVGDESEAREMLERAARGSLTLDDFLGELSRLRKLGSIQEVLSMLPLGGRSKIPVPDEAHLSRMEAMIRSMTPEERRRPEIIDGSRRRRIASGSGTSVPDVNRMLRDFRAMKNLMKGMRPGAKLPDSIYKTWR